MPNDDSIASFLLSLYSEANSRNNNLGQRGEEQVRGEYDLSASHPLIGEEADSPSRDQSSPLRDQLFGRDGVPLCYQCEDMEATIQGHITQHNNMRYALSGLTSTS